MATKKKAERKVRQGKAFEVTAKEPKDDSFGPQEQAVYDVLKKIGPATITQIGDKLKVETRQEPKLVASFYLPRLRQAGFVRQAKVTPAAA